MIFYVDDDPTIRDISVYALEATGFAVKGLSSGKELFEELENTLPELIILDIMMPGMDGTEVLRRLRRGNKTKDIPVIMASAKGTEYDKIQHLDSGADDYLAKPFGVMEMVSRVKAVLRRYKVPKNENVLTLKGIVMNDDEHYVSVDGQKLSLTLKEYDLLKLFMKNPGTALSREKLLSEVWGVNYLGESRTIDMHIKTLRQKLGEYSKLIETVIGIGYRMGGDK